jgi:hypothetical protein
LIVPPGADVGEAAAESMLSGDDIVKTPDALVWQAVTEKLSELESVLRRLLAE